MYSPSKAQFKLLYFKIPIYVESRISDGLCFENEFLFEKYKSGWKMLMGFIVVLA